MPFKKTVNWKEELGSMIEMGKAGATLVQIGAHYGVSRQRIKQVFQKFGVNPEEVGVKIVVRKRKEERAASHFKKWGIREDTDLYHSQRQKFRTKKSNAKNTGWDWTVEFGDLNWPTHCPILGIELDYFAESAQENSPSFDQIVPGKGYVTGNVMITSWRANRIKNNGTLEEHKLIVNFLEKAGHSDLDVVK